MVAHYIEILPFLLQLFGTVVEDIPWESCIPYWSSSASASASSWCTFWKAALLLRWQCPRSHLRPRPSARHPAATCASCGCCEHLRTGTWRWKMCFCLSNKMKAFFFFKDPNVGANHCGIIYVKLLHAMSYVYWLMSQLFHWMIQVPSTKVRDPGEALGSWQ